MRVDEIMTKEVHATVDDVDAEAAWHYMRKAGVRHLVVLGERDELVGVVSERDFATHEVSTLARRTVRELMSPHAVVGTADMEVREAAKLMRDHVIGCLPIVGGTEVIGIITTMDLLTLLVGDRKVDSAAAANPPVARGVVGGRILRR